MGKSVKSAKLTVVIFSGVLHSNSCNMDVMPQEQIDILHQCFNDFDAEDSGAISQDTVGSILGIMGVSYSVKELEGAMKEYSKMPGSGQIEFEEFIVLCSRFMEEEPEDNAVVIKELKEIFNLYDREDLGYMTCDCLKGILSELDPTLDDDDLDDIIDEVDEDGSGTIDFEEFCKMMVG